jgi:hypothetical protein
MRAAVALCALCAVVDAAPPSHTIVVCSPGSPGSTDEARPAMDAFAAAASAKAGVTLTAVYDPTEDGGLARLKESGLGIVALPFFLKHEKALGLHPRLIVVQKGRPALEHWSLVVQKGTKVGPGFTVVSNAAYAPEFVRGVVALPHDVKLVQSSAVLSSLRRAADGEHLAVLLDGSQTASLNTLPFAQKLDVVAKSPELPAGLVVTIDARIPDKTWAAIEAALVALGPSALASIQTDKFAPLDDKALAAARHAYASGK